MNTLQTVFVALAVVTVLHICIALASFLRRRHVFPIKGRSLTLVALQAACMSIYFLFRASEAVFPNDDLSCSAFSIYRALVNLNSIVYLGRLWRLWYLYFWARENLSKCDDKIVDEAKGTSPAIDSDQGEANEPIEPNEVVPSACRAQKMENDADGPDTKEIDESVDEMAISLGPVSSSQDESTTESKTVLGDSKRLRWFAKHRYLIQERFLQKTVVVITFVIVMAFIATYYGASSGDEEVSFSIDQPCPGVQALALFISIFGVALVIFILFSVYKLRHARDAYHLRTEFAMTLFCIILSFVVTLIFTGEGVSQLASLVVGHLYIVVSLDFPILLSLRNTSLNSRSKRRVKFPTLSEILLERKHMDLREIVREQFVKEFCVENYVFFYAAYDFEAKAQSYGSETAMARKAVAQSAFEIYDKFLGEHSPYQINLPNDMRHEVISALRVSITNFDTLVEARQKKANLTTAAFVPGTVPQIGETQEFDPASVVSKQAENNNLVAMSNSPKLTRSASQASESMAISISGGSDKSYVLQISDELAIVPTIFREARDEVLRLMDKGPFARWCGEQARKLSENS